MALSFKKGFTLIELLVVISIVGVLASVVLASVNSARKAADDAFKQSEVRQLITALELYHDTYGYYPTPTIHPVNDTDQNAIQYYFYSICLQGSATNNNTCLFRNNSGPSGYILDNTNPGNFVSELSKLIQIPIRPTMELKVKLDNLPNRTLHTYDLGGIEYNCTPSKPGQSHQVSDGYGSPLPKCQSYLLNWAYQKNSTYCVGGSVKFPPNTTDYGYQTTNTECAYSNNSQFMNNFWNDSTLVSPVYQNNTDNGKGPAPSTPN